MRRNINLSDFTLDQCTENDLDEVFCTPIFKWIERVPVWSYTRYYDKALFKFPDAVICAYWDNLENNWEL